MSEDVTGAQITALTTALNAQTAAQVLLAEQISKLVKTLCTGIVTIKGTVKQT